MHLIDLQRWCSRSPTYRDNSSKYQQQKKEDVAFASRIERPKTQAWEQGQQIHSGFRSLFVISDRIFTVLE